MAPTRSGIFISYSHDDDQKWLATLLTHLKPLIREHKIDVWSDEKIDPGQKWRVEIKNAIERARAAILLISPNFMASDFIVSDELPSILEAAAADGLTVLPVIVRRSAFDRDKRLKEFQAINSPSQPLIDMETGKRDVVFEKLAETVEQILGRSEKRTAGDTPAEKPDAPVVSQKTAVPRSKKAPIKVPAAARVTGEPKPVDLRPDETLWRPRVYFSATTDRFLDDRQRAVKQAILSAVSAAGFQPQEFGVSGLPAAMQWNFDAADEVMSNCQGGLILAQARYRVRTQDGDELALPSEYNHLEGGMAISRGLPTIVIAEEGIQERGIVFRGSSLLVLTVPRHVDAPWVLSSQFAGPFHSWCQQVSSRHHVYLGYSSSSRAIGSAIARYLASLGVRVFDWMNEFAPGRSVQGEMDRMLASSATSIFVFTRDDEMTVRGNLTLELGYFLKAKGIERTLVICEHGTALPSDLLGVAYLSLKDASDIRPIEPHLSAFVHARL